MAKLSNARIRKAFLVAERATTTTERGRALEELIAYLFSLCPGVRHWKNNVLNAAGSAEIDVCFWNDAEKQSLDFLPKILVAECKNVADRVGSADVRIFQNKLVDMRVGGGILIAANGITGDPESLTAAHDVIRLAFRDGVQIFVLTRAELEALVTMADLIRLLQDKLLLLTVQARTF